jgi:hypothetical protein
MHKNYSYFGQASENISRPGFPHWECRDSTQVHGTGCFTGDRFSLSVGLLYLCTYFHYIFMHILHAISFRFRACTDANNEGYPDGFADLPEHEHRAQVLETGSFTSNRLKLTCSCQRQDTVRRSGHTSDWHLDVMLSKMFRRTVHIPFAVYN